MQRRAFLLSFAAAMTAGLPALADSAADPAQHVVVELTQQGYSNIKVYWTWLGRLRILAHRNGGTREIVLNPRTGEILRDLWTAANGSQGTVSVLDDVNSPRSGSGTKKSSAGGSSGGAGGSEGSDGGSSDGGGSTGGSTGGASGGGGGGTSGSDSESDSKDSSGDGSNDK